MNIGSLRQRLKHMRPTLGTRNAIGEPAVSYELVSRVWGRVEPLSGDEITDAATTKGRVAAKITIRYGSKPRPEDVFVNLATGRVFQVAAILDMQSRGRVAEVAAVLHDARQSWASLVYLTWDELSSVNWDDWQ